MQTNNRTFNRNRRRNTLVSVAPLFVLLAVWPFGGSKIPMAAAPSVPAAKGVIHTSHDNNGNTKVDLSVQYLAGPGSLTPAKAAYVVWIEGTGEAPQSKGELKIDKGRSGNLSFVTPLKRFDVFVTAEESAQVSSPTGERLLSANISE